MRGETINLRISRTQKNLIDRAADALGRTRSDFMRDSACREAEIGTPRSPLFHFARNRIPEISGNARPAAAPKSRTAATPANESASGEMNSNAASVGRPEKLSREHDATAFDSGEPALDEWLGRRAWNNEDSGASRTYVVSIGRRIVGYYAIAAGAIAHDMPMVT